MSEQMTIGDLMLEVAMAAAKPYRWEIARLKKELEEVNAKVLPSEWRNVTAKQPDWRARYERLREAVEPVLRAAFTAPRDDVSVQAIVPHDTIRDIREACGQGATKKQEPSDDQVA